MQKRSWFPPRLTLLLAAWLLVANGGCGDSADGGDPATSDGPAGEDADDAGGEAPSLDGGQNPGSISAASLERLEGLYWFSETETTTSFGVGGTVSVLPTLEYYFRLFHPSGFVYVGPPLPELSEMQCTGPRMSAAGRPACVAYTRSGDTITINSGTARAQAIAKHPQGWEIGAYLYRPVPSFAGLKLAGSFRRAVCSGVSCSQGRITLSQDGKYSLSGAATSLASVGDTSLVAGQSGSSEGTYVINENAITLQPAVGAASKYFFFLEPPGNDTIVIGSTWYERDKSSGAASGTSTSPGTGATAGPPAAGACDGVEVGDREFAGCCASGNQCGFWGRTQSNATNRCLTKAELSAELPKLVPDQLVRVFTMISVDDASKKSCQAP